MRVNLVFLFLWLFTLLSYVTSVNAAEVNVSQLKSQCEKITPQQRQMAKAAGYDIDTICSSLNNIGKGLAATDDDEDKKSVYSRDAVVETDERGVIDSALENDVSLENLLLSDEELEALQEEQDLEDADMQEEEEEEEEVLERYGYGLFSGIPTTFAPATDIAIPANYMVGPNDIFNIQLLGNTNDNLELKVDRNGVINFPELGAIVLTGLNFSEAQQLIQQRVADQMIGVTAIIALGEIRSIRVFVLGEAFKPGSYTVSSLSTMTNAIFVSGGISDIGSLRSIQLKRNGETITTLDLYSLLLKGDTSGDARLLPGDVIFIPPVGATVSIKGEVTRPAIYEIKDEKTLRATIDLAGGLSSNAYPNIVSVERNNISGFASVLDIDLTDKISDNYEAQNGDVVSVHSIVEDYEDVITLSGHFHRPRSLKWNEELKISDVIKSVMDFKDDVDLSIGLIIRKKMPLREISILSFSLNNLLLKNSTADDLSLYPLDEIIVFDKTEDRAIQLEELTEKISRQTSRGHLVQTVQVSGNVQYPGIYPLAQKMQVTELIDLAGGLKEATYLGRAEVTRRDISENSNATVNHINIELDSLLNGENKFELQARDKLSIYVTPEYQEELTIEIAGEVRFPGNYEFKRGETLSQVIYRAGGFTQLAHREASIFTREELRLTEAKLLRDLQRQLEREIAASELGDQSAGAKMNAAAGDATELLDALEETEALGRLVIKLDKIMSGTDDDILLKAGDMLIVPAFRQEVSVVGEVQKGSSHMYNKEWLLDDYIDGSGGFTDRADQDRIYVVRADGSVFLPNQGGWLSHQNSMVSAGDTIVIPLEADRIKTLTLWTNVSQIIYQLALGAAALTRI